MKQLNSQKKIDELILSGSVLVGDVPTGPAMTPLSRL